MPAEIHSANGDRKFIQEGKITGNLSNGNFVEVTVFSAGLHYHPDQHSTQLMTSDQGPLELMVDGESVLIYPQSEARMHRETSSNLSFDMNSLKLPATEAA